MNDLNRTSQENRVSILFVQFVDDQVQPPYIEVIENET